jgi:hypothetical protein
MLSPAVAAGVLFWLALPMASAQSPTVDMAAASELPEAPQVAASAQEASDAPGTGVISGTVLDINSAAVPGASVRLTNRLSGRDQSTTAGADGRFSFDSLAAGRFQLTISAPGLATYVSSEIVLRAGEHAEQPRVALPVATATADVQVTVTEQEIATEQIHAEEKQRAFGVLPNFYSSYIWDAAPLSARQKFSLALRATIDPTVFLGSAVGAGVGQWVNTYGQYGQGVKGYAKRFGAAYADAADGTMIGKGALPALLHQDPRYFYRGSGTIRERVFYAMSTAVMCRSDKGHWEFNYSNVFGNLAAGGISNLYYPSHDRGIGLTFTNWAIGTAGDAASGLVREFVLRKITPGVPDYAKGKP